jgi:hypothetical protein
LWHWKEENFNHYPEDLDDMSLRGKRIFPALRYGSKMPVKYLMFVKKETSFWPWLLVSLFGISCAMAYVGFMLLKAHTVECAGTRSCVVMFFIQHIFNAVVCLLCFCKLDIRFGNGWAMFGVMLFDVIVLVWGNCTFFQAQNLNCVVDKNTMPIFFWLGAEVMFYYILTIFLLCYFFRKKCVDPYVFEQVQHEVAAGQLEALSTIRGNLKEDEDKDRFDCKNDAAHQLMLEAGYEYVGNDSKKPASKNSGNY